MYERFFLQLCENYKTTYVEGHFNLCGLNYSQEKIVGTNDIINLIFKMYERFSSVKNIKQHM